MTIFEKNTLNKIAEKLRLKNKDGRVIVTDYNDIDYPVYYEIKLERLN